MVTLRNNNADLLEEKFREIAFNNYDSHPDQYSKCFNVINSVKNNEHFSGISGLSQPGTKAEGSDMVYDDPIQLWDWTVTPVTYAQGYRLSMEALDDDQYGILGQKMFGSMGRGFKQKVEQTSADVFNNGFLTQLAADGVALFSASHTRNPEDATTHSNHAATDADLSVASLKAAINVFEDTLDHRGLNLRLVPKVLLVPTEVRFTAEEILQSNLEPFVNENTTNVLRGEGLRAEVNNYLTDPDAWFLLSEKSDHELKFVWRKSFTVKRDSDFDSWDAKFGAVMRFTVGVGDWRGTYGNPGA